MIKVKDLIEVLQAVDSKLECMAASDGEGNNYSVLSFKPSLMWVRKDSSPQCLEVIADEDYEDLDKDEKKRYKQMICVN